nr:ATP-binding cassette domain-containing protein [Rhodophyticola sp. CCM32]
MARDKTEQVARAGIARTFQNIRLLSETTVLDNIVIGFHRHEKAGPLAALLGLPSATRELRELRERAWDLLEQFNMGDYASVSAGNLAYGHQRRVEIMRAIASDPAVLMLDEPVAGMNDVESDELAQIFRDLAGRGLGLLLIEHNVGFVTRLCKHIYVLDAGRLLASGPPDQITNDPRVIEAYIGASAA